MARRLPVYLLLDCSESMVGNPLDLVNAGVHSLLSALKRDPQSMETVFVSIITFDTKARVVAPLTEVFAVHPPLLSAHPGTALGAALTLVQDSIKREVRKTTPSLKGDYKPLIFILTDGVPTDEWRGPAKSLKGVEPKIANIYAIGCGDEVDFTAMREITDNCIYLKGLTPSNIKDLFIWLSASVQYQSVSVNPDQLVSLDKIPLKKGMELVRPDNIPKPSEKPRLFFHILCSRKRNHFLARYAYSPETGFYQPGESLPLPEDFFSEGKAKGAPIDTSELEDAPTCPFCGGNDFAACPRCGTVFCLHVGDTQVDCPSCSAHIRFKADGDGPPLIIDGSQG
ncbi:MAG: VWA domain-containing protein [Deltaproteobacteria bacterium]|jgi:uncharacterized protein YegL|nr:VWA domain-containing protein [Deltaproteobacteria bacterium]